MAEKLRVDTDSDEECPAVEEEEEERNLLELIGLGSCAGRVIKIQMGGEKILGRADFDEKKLSGQHCKVALGKEGCYLVDLSKNGTFVNKKSVIKGDKVKLHPGDSISLTHPIKEKETSSKKIEFLVKYTEPHKPTKLEPLLKKQTSLNTDGLEESLTCCICQEILYKPVSCLPCLHNFCSPCYSDWIEMGQESSGNCPFCRTVTSEVRKNHGLQKAVDALISTKPTLKRSESQIQDLEKRNKITDESLRVVGAKHKYEEDDYDEQDEEEEDDGFDNETDGSLFSPQNLIPGGFALGNIQFGFGFASGDQCKECATPGPDGFACGSVKNHLRCTSCNQNFPNRPEKIQRCDVCKRPFCHAYWSCPGPGNGGGFSLLNAQHFHNIPPATTFAGNPFELNVLTTWMSSQNKTTADLWKECLEKLDRREWTPHGIICNTPNVKSDNYSCGNCASKIFGGLLYHLRRSIPDSELPDAISQRSECWYGLQCRTQHNKPVHAANLNHVCPNTRGGG
eukprot:TRINITY_DN12024_c0_g1_i1.p1 TRINITY_DN12024_c0_g1~~TRINITY_DN12024_c0_g1_i1.p1  ORF type:complete len:510 (+),score=68.70 TRINITY_DN12024_c0_g1_i1:56-1585(+)